MIPAALAVVCPLAHPLLLCWSWFLINCCTIAYSAVESWCRGEQGESVFGVHLTFGCALFYVRFAMPSCNGVL